MVPPPSENEIVIQLDQFFERLDRFEHGSIIADRGRPWKTVERIGLYIREQTGLFARATSLPSGVEVHPVPGENGQSVEEYVWISKSVRLSEDLVLPIPRIRIGRGTLLEAGAMIKGPALIGRSCEIRQGAYLRGDLVAGDRVVLGHATEVKNSVIMNHTVAGHFNYIGDSILGEHVNLGAGTVLANLQFRLREEKRNFRIEPIELSVLGARFDSGLTKFGAILGDYIETGCNSVTSPGTMIGKECWIYPNTLVEKEVYAPKQVIRSAVSPDVSPR